MAVWPQQQHLEICLNTRHDVFTGLAEVLLYLLPGYYCTFSAEVLHPRGGEASVGVHV